MNRAVSVGQCRRNGSAFEFLFHCDICISFVMSAFWCAKITVFHSKKKRRQWNVQWCIQKIQKLCVGYWLQYRRIAFSISVFFFSSFTKSLIKNIWVVDCPIPIKVPTWLLISLIHLSKPMILSPSATKCDGFPPFALKWIFTLLHSSKIGFTSRG